ncbi:unnamed protein product (macronuclear) [Paramecium tetraurelia]|uniref:Uncharacterized protein n=1 Tax=Paramecium tetraurelia TaxID=5888 RepID=A0C457_PARTE|nr:uncharacterized protein GSPATT00035054001 [Paramecium tetraurelia]CAK65574.1 unnamed protein product [Paramecium tetraurelia]|eukprot:XP_001432971.1 hypothetical protein (macronuclear) [Paramecium tetraurelia strain d4-2]
MNKQQKNKSLPPAKANAQHKPNQFQEIENCKQAIKDIIQHTETENKPKLSQHRSVDKTQQKKQIHSTVQEYNGNVGKMFTSTKYGIQYMQKKVMHNIDQL